MTLAAIDQGDAVAVFRLVEEVGGDQHGDAVLDDGVDVRPEFAPGQRIDAGGGLVEKKHLRVVHDGAGQGQPLLVAERQLAGTAVEIGAEVERLGHARGGLAAAFPLQAVDAGEEIEVLTHAQVAIEREFLGHVAEPRRAAPAATIEVEAGDMGLAGGRP